MISRMWRQPAARDWMRRWLRSLRVAARAAIAGVGDDAAGWAAVVGGALIVALALLAGLQSLALVALSHGRSLAIQSAAVAPAAIIAASCIAFLAWGVWRTRHGAEDFVPYTLTALSFAIVVGSCVVAFAGVHWILWDERAVRAVGTPTLWRLEQLYLWHLVDAIPLLDVPRTLHWQQPRVFSDHLSGALVLGFKLVVILPLLRLAVGGVRFGIERWAQFQERSMRAISKLLERGADRRSSLDPESPARVAWVACAAFLVLATLSAAAFRFLLDPSSIGYRAIARLPDQITLAGGHYPLVWIQAAPSFAVAAFLLYALAVAPTEGMLPNLAAAERGVVALGMLMIYLTVLVLLTEAAAATLLGLVHLGIARTTAPLPPSNQGAEASGFLLWHGLDAIPGLAIPRTLNWSLHYEFTDRWSGITLLGYKLVFLALLAVPITRVASFYLRRFRRARARPSGLAEVEAFAAGLFAAAALLDESTRLVRRGEVVHQERRRLARAGDGASQPRRTGPRGGGGRFHDRERDRLELHREWTRLAAAASDEVRALRRKLPAVAAVFGDAPPGERADGAVSTLQAWASSLDEVRPLVGISFLDVPFKAVTRSATEARAAMDTYARAAEEALRAHLAKVSAGADAS